MAELSSIPSFQVPQPVTRQVVRVQLDNGTIVEREPGQLVAIPAGMVLPLTHMSNSH